MFLAFLIAFIFLSLMLLVMLELLLSPPPCFLACVDEALGKVDKASLSQLTLLEMFMEGIENRKDTWKTGTQPDSFSEWHGVKANEHDEIVRINWSYSYDLQGTVNLHWLPSTVVTLFLFSNKLTGSLDLCVIPSSMKDFRLQMNEFTGHIDLTHLPQNLRILNVSTNKLSGPLDFTQLPRSLTKLYLHANDFGGECDFTQLPKSLSHLDVSDTNLSGKIEIDKKVGIFFRTYNSEVKAIW